MKLQLPSKLNLAMHDLSVNCELTVECLLKRTSQITKVDDNRVGKTISDMV